MFFCIGGANDWHFVEKIHPWAWLEVRLANPMGSLSPESRLEGLNFCGCGWISREMVGSVPLQDGCSTSNNQEGKSATDTGHPGLARISGARIQASVTGQE